MKEQLWFVSLVSFVFLSSGSTLRGHINDISVENLTGVKTLTAHSEKHLSALHNDIQNLLKEKEKHRNSNDSTYAFESELHELNHLYQNRKLITDADSSERCFSEGRSYYPEADFNEDPFRANNDRGDWGKCLPEEMFGIMCEHEIQHMNNDGTWQEGDGPLHDELSEQLFKRLKALHDNQCIHIDLDIPLDVQSAFNDFLKGQNKYAPVIDDGHSNDATFRVLAVSGKYILNGATAPEITIRKGITYTFDVSSVNQVVHPFWIGTAVNVPYSTGEYVTYGDGYVSVLIPIEVEAPSLVYYCGNHPTMGNAVNVAMEAPLSINVEVIDGIFYLDGEANPLLTLERGKSYDFVYENLPFGLSQLSSTAEEDTGFSMTYIELNNFGTEVVTDLGKEAFNAAFAACPVVQYTRNGYPYAVYKRTSPIPDDFDAYDIFTYTWASTDNMLHEDFELYDTLAHVKALYGAWQFCNYDDNDVGFPRDCGRDRRFDNRWFSMPGGRHRTPELMYGASFQVHSAGGCPAATDSNLVEYTEGVTEIETGLRLEVPYEAPDFLIYHDSIGDVAGNNIAIRDGRPVGRRLLKNSESQLESTMLRKLQGGEHMHGGVEITYDMACVQRYPNNPRLAMQMSLYCMLAFYDSGDVSAEFFESDYDLAPSCAAILGQLHKTNAPARRIQPDEYCSQDRVLDTCTVQTNTWYLTTRSCQEYCEGFPGLTCKSAHLKIENCYKGREINCDEYVDFSDMLCTCGTASETSESDVVGTSTTTLTPSAEALIANSFENGAIHTSIPQICTQNVEEDSVTAFAFTYGYSCNDFCENAGMVCIASTADLQDDCVTYPHFDCSGLECCDKGAYSQICTCGWTRPFSSTSTAIKPKSDGNSVAALATHDYIEELTLKANEAAKFGAQEQFQFLSQSRKLQGATKTKSVKKTRTVTYTQAVNTDKKGKKIARSIGAQNFNANFRACPMVRYVRNGKSYAIYRRLTPVPSGFDAWKYFTSDWSDTDNVLGVDFTIYSEHEDAVDDVTSKRWRSCVYNQAKQGFPGECGRFDKAVANKWFSSKRMKGITKFAILQIYDEDTCPITTLEPIEPSMEPSKSPIIEVEPSNSPIIEVEPSNSPVEPSTVPVEVPTVEPTNAPIPDPLQPTNEPTFYPTRQKDPSLNFDEFSCAHMASHAFQELLVRPKQYCSDPIDSTQSGCAVKVRTNSVPTRTCTEFCATYKNMECTAAAAYDGYGCLEEGYVAFTCDSEITTSHMVCQCGVDEESYEEDVAEMEKPIANACINMALGGDMTSFKSYEFCESDSDTNTCTVNVDIRHQEVSCNDYCSSYDEMECTAAYNDDNYDTLDRRQCRPLSEVPCDTVFEDQNYMRCKCGFSVADSKRALTLHTGPNLGTNIGEYCPAYTNGTIYNRASYQANEEDRMYQKVTITLGIDEERDDGSMKVAAATAIRDRHDSSVDTYNTNDVEVCTGLETLIDENSDPLECSFGHRLSPTSNCYGKLEMNFNDASRTCAARGGHLLRIDNQEELDGLKQLFPDQRFTIGLKADGTKYGYEWDGYPGCKANLTELESYGLDISNTWRHADCLQLALEHNELWGQYCYYITTFICESYRPTETESTINSCAADIPSDETDLGGDLLADEGGFCLWYLDDPDLVLPDDESNGFRNTELAHWLAVSEQTRTAKYFTIPEYKYEYYRAELSGHGQNIGNLEALTQAMMGLDSIDPVVEGTHEGDDFHCHFSPTNFGISRIYLQQHMLERLYPGSFKKHCFCGYKHLAKLVSRCDCTKNGVRNGNCQKHHRRLLAEQTYKENGEYGYCNNGQCEQASP